MKTIYISIIFICSLFGQFEYSNEDMNNTSPSYGESVWNPTYSNYITLHYFSSQG